MREPPDGELLVPDIAQVDVDAAGRLLARVEAQHERAGWNGALVVYAVYEPADVVSAGLIERLLKFSGTPVQAGRYAAQPMLGTKIFTGALQAGCQPWEALRNFAHGMAFTDTDLLQAAVDDGGADLPDPEALGMFRQFLHLPGIVGFAACYETSALKDLPAAAFRKVLASDRHFSEYRGAQQARLALMVDVHDRVHRVERIRGRIAELELDVPMRGDFTTSLRLLMDLAQDRLPADQAGYDQRYPTLRQLHGVPPPG